MNERIEKLSQLAWTKTSESVPFYDSTGNISRDFNLKYQQEFAELIVRECTSLFDGTKEMKTVGMLTHNQVVEQIKQHFGVEE